MHGSFLRLTMICLATLALPAAAQIHTWKDESGRVIMSDKPPPGKQSVRKKDNKPIYDIEEAPSPKAAKPASTARDAKAGIDPELDKRKKEAEAKAAAERAAKEKAYEDDMKAACSEMKRNLAALESGQRMAQLDAKGERYFMDDEQRAKQVTEVRRRLAACK